MRTRGRPRHRPHGRTTLTFALLGRPARTHDHLRSPYRDDVTKLFAEAFACVLTRRVTRLIHLITEEKDAEQAYHWLAGSYNIG